MATNLVLGRGQLFFDRFLDGTTVGEGERYIGNTTSFAVSREVEEVKRLRSVNGQLVEAASVVTRETIKGAFTTDDMSPENVALWFGSKPDTSGQDVIGFINESFTVRKGRYYQLGKSYQPMGIRHAENVTFSIDGVDLALAGEIELDKAEGRFLVLPEATTIQDGDLIDVHFEWRSSPGAATLTNEPEEVLGALRFISTNPVGPRKHYFFPSVRITSTGDASLKGDEWQQLAFEVEVRKLNPVTDRMYVVEIAGALYTEDEQAIIDLSNLGLDDFPVWDDELNTILNITIPSRGYLAA